MSILIAGGGVAGATAATLLGPRATLFERERGPHDKICGDFISWEGQEALSLLGLDLAELGAARIDLVRLAHGKKVASAALPAPGMGLSRRILDEALLARAVENGARVVRGKAVRKLIPGGLEIEGDGPLHAKQVFLSTGKHDLRGAKRAGRSAPLVGLKMYYRLAPGRQAALAGAVEVVMFPGGYAGLQPIEAGLANLCLLINRRTFERAGTTWPGVVAHLIRTSPLLADRLDGASAKLERPVAIFRVPYGFLHAQAPVDLPNVLRLGDQMGVIPSFSGDGMSMALHTAFAAVASLDDAAGFHRRMRQDFRGQIGRAMILHRLGQSNPGLLAIAARVWPGALALVARLTRVPSARLAWR